VIRLQDPELSPLQDHSAWQKTWNDDERLLAYTPPGYWSELVGISQAKRLLQQEMPADLRLRFLEYLDKSVHGHLTLEAMQRVQPACDTAMRMLDETNSLSRQDKYRLMNRWNVMANFCNLNPSIIEAMKLFHGAARSNS
jgi:hypothetical protein